MREILYRAYHGGYKCFLYGYIHFTGKYWTLRKHGDTFPYIIDKNTIGEFAGLYDNTAWEDLPEKEQNWFLKSGKTKEDWQGRKIFEGDIIKSIKWNPQIHKVSFTDGAFSFGYEGNFYQHDLGAYNKEFKVIGNIHENPELYECAKGDTVQLVGINPINKHREFVIIKDDSTKCERCKRDKKFVKCKRYFLFYRHFISEEYDQYDKTYKVPKVTKMKSIEVTENIAKKLYEEMDLQNGIFAYHIKLDCFLNIAGLDKNFKPINADKKAKGQLK